MADGALPTKILVVDRDDAFINSIENCLQKHTIKVYKANRLDTALYLFNQNRFEIVMVELEFTDLPGLALVQKWREHENQDRRNVGFIAVANKGRTAQEEGLIRELGAVEVVTKPINLAGFVSVIARVMAARQKAADQLALRTKVLDFYDKTRDADKAISMILPKVQEMGTDGHEMLMTLYENANRWPDALATISKLLETRSNDISLMNAKARALLKLGKNEEACALMEKADSLAPMNIKRLEAMADLYLKMQNPDKGAVKLKQLVDLNPEDPEYRFVAMQKLFDHGFDEHARNFGRQNVSPMDIVRHYNNKGVAMSKAGNPEKAVGEYTRALDFFPTFKENYRILYNIALAKINKKDPLSLKEAEEALKKCLKLNPSFEKAKAALDTIVKRSPGASIPKKAG